MCFYENMYAVLQVHGLIVAFIIVQPAVLRHDKIEDESRYIISSVGSVEA